MQRFRTAWVVFAVCLAIPVASVTGGWFSSAWAQDTGGRKLVELSTGALWRVENGQGVNPAGYLLATEVGIVALDPLPDDPAPPEEAGTIILIVSSYAVADEDIPHGDIPLVEPGGLDMEAVYELGQEKLHLIPMQGPFGKKILVLWAARQGLVLAPALLEPRPAQGQADVAAWKDGLAVLGTLKPRRLLPEPAKPLAELDEDWMQAVAR